MPRYEIPAVICIDAKDAEDLKRALEQSKDEDGGCDYGPDRTRHGRAYATNDLEEDMERPDWVAMAATYVVDETEEEYRAGIAQEEAQS